jgi:hypothetical protein
MEIRNDILTAKLLTEESEIPSKYLNPVNIMETFSASLIPRSMVCNSGRRVKLTLPTEIKFGMVSVCNAVKSNKLNVPLILCKPDAVKDARTEIPPTETSPTICCTPCGIVMLSIATEFTVMLPVTVAQFESASRSDWCWIINPLVFVQVPLP